MGKAEFERSLQDGRHRDLAAMAGQWHGTTRVWFEPDKPAAIEVVQQGSLRSVLGGRFLLHEYRYEGDQAGEGFAFYGVHLDEKSCEAAWIDSSHTGTSILFSTSPDTGTGFSALGDYGDGQGGPRWGWRTTIEQHAPDALLIVMYNIIPGGEDMLALETRYSRVDATDDSAVSRS